ncbi:MAG TPA: hypothetical protein VH969_18315 [Actinophytocola sp.]|jgi:hypothetical protein|uniref:hypothetical protein n=1 Tax=Actinophytocola sp. TaxID=1872138 RepID=UPI002F94195A
MRRPAIGLLVLVAVAVSGCAGTQAAPTASPATDLRVSAGATEWMTDLCTIAGDLRNGLWASATGDGPLRKRLHDQLDTAAGKVDTALGELRTMPDAPVPGGDAAVTQLGDELGELRDALVRGRGALAALPADTGEDRLGQALGAVWPQAAARAAKPFTGVTVSDAMRNAATGPDCATIIPH